MTFPPLPGADHSRQVAVACAAAVLLPEGVRLRRGDPYPLDHPVVLAHPSAFDVFSPPPLSLR